MQAQARALRVGESLSPARLIKFLVAQGYQEVDLVRTQGEFARRGGLLDLFVPAANRPTRLDFFGDTLESMRSFDPLSQRSLKERSGLLLLPAREIPQDDRSRERFRVAYRALSHSSGVNDPLYEAVTAGRAYAGVEQWQPLFFEGLVPLFDYLPLDMPLVLDSGAQAAVTARRDSVADFYAARQAALASDQSAPASPQTAAAYHPVAPERFLLTAEQWEALAQARPLWLLSPFMAPEAVPEAVPKTAPEVVPEAAQLKASDAVKALQQQAATRPPLSFVEARQNPDANLYEAVRLAIRDAQRRGQKVLISATSTGARVRLAALLFEQGVKIQKEVDSSTQLAALKGQAVGFAVLPLDSGFQTDQLAVISEQDILGQRLAQPQRRRKAEQFLRDAGTLTPGDLVVHRDNGIGRYEGLETLELNGAAHDVLHLSYAEAARLYVPVENIEVLSRFGEESSGVALDKLGAGNWQLRKAKAKEKLKDMAESLMRVAAARTQSSAPEIVPDTGAMNAFAAGFPFSETDDQLNAIEDTLADLAAGRPMDRLICGDVGFGKTEVALRAAFAVAMEGFQVALLVPTTLLARQHFMNFSARFANTPVRVAQLSRLVGTSDQQAIKTQLEAGEVDIVIGTHALLASGLRFKRLGLLVLDEEQRFGVKQKEQIKALRASLHVLTLTATPIPRTLQLSLTGVKDMSLIATPPIDRLAVRSFVMPWDGVMIREALMREHFRGGQSFVVCPRVRDLAELQERIETLTPELKLGVAHGQLSSTQLEKVMDAFLSRQFDVLISTNIIETGIDIATANTLVVHRADRFGLGQLYQLRGRIGRSKERGYAYLTLPAEQPITAEAQKRLEAMQTLDSLGAGFTLASHDMDIRGAGNLVGEEQSGHIREVGIELYQQLLEEAVARARLGEDAQADSEATAPQSIQINLGVPVLIPEDYVADIRLRLALYRRLGDLQSAAEIEAFAAELIDRFGALPDTVQNLLDVMRLKQQARSAGVTTIDVGPKGVVLGFHQNRFAKPEALLVWVAAHAKEVKIRPDQRLFYARQLESLDGRLAAVQRILRHLQRLLDAA
jgi:transcription-repair coupling factor (superfamily II helicase)